jgi:preprotein translocase subunit SecD
VRHNNGWRIIFILLIVLVSLATMWHMWPPRLGLDLKGGIDVVLEAQNTPEHEVTDEDMVKLKLAIERRVNKTNLAEPVIVREGARRIRVQLPEVKNREQAMEIIGRTAMLTFKDPDGNIVLTGSHLVNASAGFSQERGGAAVFLEFNKEGGDIFGKVTERLAKEPIREKRILSIYLDDELVSAPEVQYGKPIFSQHAEITGLGDIEKAKTTALLLKSGALPVPVEVLSDNYVDPTLGQEAVSRSMKAGLVGVILVFVYMLIFYRFLGSVADIALGIYIIFVLSALMSLQATLTLPGIAGLILSVGMAVDANVIIFERIKEELKSGKRLRAAIDAGFDRAFSAILDANVTTLITAGVLFYFGTGAIKGFAITLSVGILASMFTAIVATRWIMAAIVSRNPERYTKYFAR